MSLPTPVQVGALLTAAREAGRHRRVALAGDEGGQHGPPGDPERVADDDRELDQRILEELLHPLLVGGASREAAGPRPGSRCQAAAARMAGPAVLRGWKARKLKPRT